MPAEPAITTEATVVEVLDSHTCTAELPNGKVVHAHLPRRKPGAELQTGQTVNLEMNPYDFSRARIAPADANPSNPQTS